MDLINKYDFLNYFRRACISDINSLDRNTLDSLRLEDGSWRFAKKIFGRGGILLNGGRVCRTPEQIENALRSCGVFFSSKVEMDNFFKFIVVFPKRFRAIPTKGDRYIRFDMLETDNEMPEYLISMQYE